MLLGSLFFLFIAVDDPRLFFVNDVIVVKDCQSQTDQKCSAEEIGPADFIVVQGTDVVVASSVINI